MSPPAVSARFAERIALFGYRDLSADLVDRAKLCLLDTLGAMLVASAPKYSGQPHHHAPGERARRQGRVLAGRTGAEELVRERARSPTPRSPTTATSSRTTWAPSSTAPPPSCRSPSPSASASAPTASARSPPWSSASRWRRASRTRSTPWPSTTGAFTRARWRGLRRRGRGRTSPPPRCGAPGGGPRPGHAAGVRAPRLGERSHRALAPAQPGPRRAQRRHRGAPRAPRVRRPAGAVRGEVRRVHRVLGPWPTRTRSSTAGASASTCRSSRASSTPRAPSPTPGLDALLGLAADEKLGRARRRAHRAPLSEERRPHDRRPSAQVALRPVHPAGRAGLRPA